MASHLPPTREEHPLPAVIMHAVHMLSLVLLVLSGFYINSPFFHGGMGVMRSIHQVAMWTFLLTTIIRIYWAFMGAGSAPPGGRVKGPDYKWFSPLRREGEASLGQTLKYYTFMRKTYPKVYKFNPLQKYTYLTWAFVLVPLSALTGLAIWEPTQNFFQSLSYAVGGLAVMRALHYLIMWAFVITVGIHIYLTLAEVLREWPMMFAWREPRRKTAAARRTK